MKKYTKAGLLILTLAIPALIFIFLKGFTTNHFELPYLNPARDTLGKVIMKGNDTVFTRRKEIVLVNADSSLNRIELGGSITVIGFLPANCNDRCVRYLEYLSRIAKLNSAVPNLRLVTLTDGLELKTIGQSYGMGSNTWQAHLISLEKGNNALASELNIYKSADGSKTNFSFSRLFLIDTEGYTRGYFDLSDTEELDRLLAEIRILDYQLKHRNI
ncbi:hypothetical protein [Dyadobacter tibetensis]|uniref:hypothetical protein n=1 Tax=Dyadobacter tibetensis TaxID=1211851 RepID=UPI0004724693|nr:hypothetical protein [Dyadobacter tibetensis]